MKKTIGLVMMISLLSQASFAISNIKAGRYVGQTEDGVACYLSISGSGQDLSFGMAWKGAFGDGLNCRAKSMSQSGNVVKLSGSADMAAGNAAITLANDGTPVEAKMGIGALMVWGYQIDCKNLAAE